MDIQNWVIYCAIGCNHAHTVYVDHFKRQVGVPSTAPSLVPSLLTNDSITIEWNGPNSGGQAHVSPSVAAFYNVTTRIQWKYDHLPSTWTYINDSLIDTKHNRVTFQPLFPYTAYLFRIEWVLVPWLHISLFSPPTAPITTRPYGVPSTPCLIESCFAISPTQLSITWQQPTFSNGQILAYTLVLTDNSNGQKRVKDVRIETDVHLLLHPNDPKNYIFNGLKSSTPYNVSIATHNNFGEGPLCECSVTTLSSPQSPTSLDVNHESDDEDGSTPETPTELELTHIYIASNTEVSRRSLEAFLSDSEVTFHLTDYVNNAEITGIAVHVEQKYLFVSDTSGTIRRVSLGGSGINPVQRIIDGVQSPPSHLSIDWLRNKLYWIEENKISRSNLDGDQLESVITGFQARPVDMKVDPFNGYLFWIVHDVENNTQFFRIDLADVDQARLSSTAGKQHQIAQIESKIQLIYDCGHPVNTFVVNYYDYRIYFPSTFDRSIFSITIDGKDLLDVRDNSNSEDVFENIENMVVYKNLFYFSKGSKIHWEEYNSDDDEYYHNSYDTNQQLVAMLVMNYHSQPYPVPLNPVQNVQAIFLDTQAKISWTKPALFGGSGRGVWRDWDYEVSIEERTSNVTHLAPVINNTNCLAEELKPDTEYWIKVRALSKAGKGEWSSVFRGRTLDKMDYNERGIQVPFAVVSNEEGLMRTDIAGNIHERLLTRGKLEGAIVTGKV